jgi:hypothetical protein
VFTSERERVKANNRKQGSGCRSEQAKATFGSEKSLPAFRLFSFGSGRHKARSEITPPKNEDFQIKPLRALNPISNLMIVLSFAHIFNLFPIVTISWEFVGE